jgi:hypothetical protein
MLNPLRLDPLRHFHLTETSVIAPVMSAHAGHEAAAIWICAKERAAFLHPSML